MFAAITATEYHLPEKQVTNQQLAALHPEWTAKQILDKTGIEVRCHAAADECPSDLAFQAAQKLFASGACEPAAIDFLLYCTQGADYRIPATACVLQDRLGLPSARGPGHYSRLFRFCLRAGPGEGIDRNRAGEQRSVPDGGHDQQVRPSSRPRRSLPVRGCAAATLIQATGKRRPNVLAGLGRSFTAPTAGDANISTSAAAACGSETATPVPARMRTTPISCT